MGSPEERYRIETSVVPPSHPGPGDWPYTSLRAALEALGRHAAAVQWTSGQDVYFDIVRQPPAPGKQPRRRPVHRFFVHLQAHGEGGDGSETSPWWGVRAAVAGLVELAELGEIELAPGRRLRLRHVEMFSASSLERAKRIKEVVAQAVLLAMTLMLVLPLAGVVGYLVVRAWPALSWDFVWQNPQDYMTAGGVWAPLVGTFFLVLGSLAVAAPIGVLAGIYLNEYAPDNWWTRLINLAVMNLAGVPSIVHALFGVGAFVFALGMGKSLLAASCTVAVMTLPVIITSTREALASVPMAFREACWNLGATRWQTIRTIVLPNSISGILTGVILQVSRAAGETAPILFTGAVFFVPVADHGLASLIPYGPGDRFMALSMHLFTLATQVRGVPESTQYGTAVVLIALVLAVNSLSIGLRMYFRTRKRW